MKKFVIINKRNTNKCRCEYLDIEECNDNSSWNGVNFRCEF